MSPIRRTGTQKAASQRNIRASQTDGQREAQNEIERNRRHPNKQHRNIFVFNPHGDAFNYNVALNYSSQQIVAFGPMNVVCQHCKAFKNEAPGLCWANGQLYVYDEMLEAAPQYLTTISLFREIRPKFILTIGNSKSDEFIKILSDIITYGDSYFGSTTTTDTQLVLPKNLLLVSAKEYTYEICKAIISQINLASMDDELPETKREVFIHSLINFDDRLSLKAIGTLVKYLEKNWSFFGLSDKTDMCYMHINHVSRKDQVLMDNSTFQALQIFSKRFHEANFKRGAHSSQREGLSLFKLFSMRCKSKIGLMTLKKVLLNPINNAETINKRLDFIEFVQDPNNKEFVESLRDNLKLILGDINVILTRIENSRAKSRDWHVLYKAIYHTIFIKEISSPYIEKYSLFMELHEKVSLNLLGLEESIKNGLDFDVSKRGKQPEIKFGLDDKLDAKKLRRQDIINDVLAAARLMADNLPDFLDECSVVYLPEMGHLISLKEWSSNCSSEDLEPLGFQFVFKIGGRIHYKNPMCIELDKRLGDIISEIIDHENRILRRLSGFVIKYNKDIRDPLKVIGMIDCLISMALTASSKLYTRPALNKDNHIELEDCRHPLMELITDRFQTNNFYSGGKNSRIKIITGPNGSGKSVYLKEICLITYLAHIGSFVPCTRANITLLDTMYTRLLATESASVRLSSFMIDLKQMVNALNDSSLSSIIFMDEFGKGTLETEGICVLEAALKHFIGRGMNCPHVLVSTHFDYIPKSIPESHLIEYQKMVHTNENGVLYFMYKISNGVSISFAFDVAEFVGIEKDVIKRAREIYNCLVNEEPIQPWPKLLQRNNFDAERADINISEYNEDFSDSV